MSREDFPRLLFADRFGNIMDHPRLEMVGSEAGKWRRLNPDEWIPLPEGSELFVLPGRLPVGFDPIRKRFVVLSQNPYGRDATVQAVAASVAPAHTALLSTAYRTQPNAPVLPLFSYTAVGWFRGQFVVAAMRVDPDERQDVRYLNLEKVRQQANLWMKRYRHNRLIQHLGRCALTYACPAARNFFLKRWEAPLPSSPYCNAQCIGCISLQKNSPIPSTQQRIRFVPSPEEIAEVAVIHLKKATRPVVSFGQGCEGEPLLVASTIEESIRLIREETSSGTINMNTNGSLPRVLEKLARAGLQSVRVSLNSLQPHYYHAYYRPKGYTFENIKEFIIVAKTLGLFVSLNYFMLPGVTDDPAEVEALERFLRDVPIDLIQMRNFNIDPEWYIDAVGFKPTGSPRGIKAWMERIREILPQIRFGYFNPSL
ncbi:MAG: radical SAM protein [Syntrophobacterales bacterium]|nr:radical SAM protein [Syntrophobacterales bacterium]